jgi:CheY-like chemotaxis protein
MADDEEVYLKATAELLGQLGFLVDTATDAFQARDCLRARQYDVLVSDLRMPGNENLEFLQEVGKLNPYIQIILVTGYPTVESAMQSVQLPVVAYLSKPVDFDLLAEHIRRAAAMVRTRLAITQSRGRLEAWVEDLDRLQSLATRTGAESGRDLTRDLLGLAMGNMAGVLLDMKAVFESTFGGDSTTTPCAIRSCPRLETYRSAVQESIEVLEHTRHAFKSKELGQLRERLEQVRKG